MTTSLLLTRHAPTSAAPGTVLGWHDAGLSDVGHGQAVAFAEGLGAALPEPPIRIVASDLRRAQETAAPLAKRWGLPVEADRRLREVCFGRWEGRSWDEVEADDGDALGAWMAAWTDVPPPGGESFADVAASVGGWLAGLASGAGGPVVVVAHAGSLRALVCQALGLPHEAAFGFTFDPLRLSRLDRTAMGGPGGWALTLHNAHPSSLIPDVL